MPFCVQKQIVTVFLVAVSIHVGAQNTDSIAPSLRFFGMATLTTKGISTIPNLTLGKPAGLFDLAIGGKRLSFEPQFRFSLEAKPWTFIFWWRYKLINQNKWRVALGAHPAFTFKTISAEMDGKEMEIQKVNRYLAAELVPAWYFSTHSGVGLYYLFSHGLEPEAIQYTHLIAVKASFNQIKLIGKWWARFYPQVYFLDLDEQTGFFYNHIVYVARTGFPLSVSSNFTYAFHTEIPNSSGLLWNLSLIYTAGGVYVKK